MKFISWLHLTDLHAGTPDHERLWKNVLGKLRNDIPKLLRRTESLDLVFFTGDLSFQGSHADFKIVDDALRDLWKMFEEHGHKPVLVAVPGNHDLQWPSSKKSQSDVRSLRHWHSDPELRQNFWNNEKDPCRKVIEEAFKPFSEWYLGWQADHPHDCYKSLSKGLLPGDFAMTVEKDDIRLGLVGLNSAFLQLQNYDDKLDLDLLQLNKVCNGDPDKWCNKHHCAILLTHHPSDWLREEREKEFYKEIAQPERFLIHLYGHMHGNAMEYIRTGGQKTIRMAQGAALFSPESNNRKEKRIHGYSGGRLDINFEKPSGKLRIWPRIVKFPIAVKSGYYLAPDWDNFELDEDDAFATDDFSVELPQDTLVAVLLSRCLQLSTRDPRLKDELRECSKIANSSEIKALKLEEIDIARIRIEMYLLSPRLKDEQPDSEQIEQLWNGVFEIATQLKKAQTEQKCIEIQTSFALQATNDGICRYFNVLEELKIDKEKFRFLVPVKVVEGFLAPIHLLTGLLDRFEEDWTTVLKAFSRSVSDEALPPWQALQSFIFDCWLLWGPSIPICTCELWTSTQNGALMLQYGYGDENNSLPVYLTSDQLSTLRALVWSKPIESGEGWQPGLAQRMTLTGTLVSADDFFDRPLPSLQMATLVSDKSEGDESKKRKYDYVLEYIAAVGPTVTSRGEYYSAYIWIIFEVELDSSPDCLGERWRRLLPFFEHTNIADATAYDFMKEQLARKALSFISHYNKDKIKFNYACSFDDPGHGPASEYKALFTFAQYSIQQAVEELLSTEEFSHIRPYVNIRPDQPVLTSCELTELVNDFYDYISKVSSH